MTTVGHIKDKKPGDVYIGRGSPYGNPYVIGKDGDRTQVIEKFEKHFHERMRNDTTFFKAVSELRGKHIVCYCSPKACHGHVIAEYLNISKGIGAPRPVTD